MDWPGYIPVCMQYALYIGLCLYICVTGNETVKLEVFEPIQQHVKVEL